MLKMDKCYGFKIIATIFKSINIVAFKFVPPLIKAKVMTFFGYAYLLYDIIYLRS